MIRSVIAAAALALAPGMAAQTAEMTFYQLPAGAYRAKVTAEFAGNPVTVTEAFLTVN